MRCHCNDIICFLLSIVKHDGIFAAFSNKISKILPLFQCLNQYFRRFFIIRAINFSKRGNLFCSVVESHMQNIKNRNGGFRNRGFFLQIQYNQKISEWDPVRSISNVNSVSFCSHTRSQSLLCPFI